MPEERRPSIVDTLHEEVVTHEREMQRFRRALRGALEGYLGNGDGGEEQ